MPNTAVTASNGFQGPVERQRQANKLLRSEPPQPGESGELTDYQIQ